MKKKTSTIDMGLNWWCSSPSMIRWWDLPRNCTGNALNILNCTGTLPIWCMMAITSTFFSPTTGYHLAGLKASPFHIVICVNICQKTSKKLSNVRLNHQERYIKIPSSSRFHPTISTSHPQTSPPSQHDGTIGSVCPNSISWREF